MDSDLAYDSPLAEVRSTVPRPTAWASAWSDIGESLAVLVGENYVNRFGMDGRSYDVIPQVPQDRRLTPDNLGAFYVKYVRTQDNTLVPLSTVVSVAVKVRSPTS